MKKTSVMDYVKIAAQIIYDKKGMNILALDVRNLSSITDYLLIADGNVEKHVIAMAKELLDVLQEAGVTPLHVEGLETGDWIVLDFPAFMIHLLIPSFREKYQLERIWPESKLIDLTLKNENISG